jgi:hypothetical protein
MNNNNNDNNNDNINNNNSVTIPTERTPVVGELVPTFADRGVSRGQGSGKLRP